MSLSIVEFAVYGGVAYFTLALVISLIVKNNPVKGFDRSTMRITFIIPGAVCMALLSTFGVEITMGETTTYEVQTVTINGTVQETVTESTEKGVIALEDIRWFTIHGFFFLVLLLYLMFQFAEFLTKSHT